MSTLGSCYVGLRSVRPAAASKQIHSDTLSAHTYKYHCVCECRSALHYRRTYCTCALCVFACSRRLAVQTDGKLLDGDGKLVGASVAVVNPKGQSRALSLVGSVDWIQARNEKLAKQKTQTLLQVYMSHSTRTVCRCIACCQYKDSPQRLSVLDFYVCGPSCVCTL